MKVNSKEYWQQRFSDGNWEKYDGDLQSHFFSQMFLDIMPDWLKKDLSHNNWDVADYGCAEGGGTALIAKHFPGCRFTGYDFSSVAVACARERYPGCQFMEGDLTQDIPQTDVIFSSNTLEHMVDPTSILKKLVEASTKHTIILVPFEDDFGFKEHLHYFTAHFFRDSYADHYISFCRVVDCRGKNIPYWPGKQMILVYTNVKFRQPSDYRVAELCDETVAPFVEEAYQQRTVENGLKKELETEKAGKQQAENSLQAAQRELEALQETCQTATCTNEEQKLKLTTLQQELETVQNSLLLEQQSQAETRTCLESLKQELEERKNRFQCTSAEKDAQLAVLQQKLTTAQNALQHANTEKDAQLAVLQQKLTTAQNALQRCNTEKDAQLAVLQQELTATQNAFQQAMQNREENSAQITNVLNSCNELVQHKAFRLVHLITRIRHQLIRGNREQRKGFWKWFWGRFKHEIDLNHSYNPMFYIINPLYQIRGSLSADLRPVQFLATESVAPATVERNWLSSVPATTASILQQEYSKFDVIVFSVINYDFRFQRPQHFAKRFAENGHRVFYINANFINPESVKEVEKNLFVADFMTPSCNAIYFNNEWSGFEEWIWQKMTALLQTYAVRDAIMILDYPNWIHAAEMIRIRYGFKIVADYMDDATGFLGTTTDVLKENCEQMLRTCDLVVPSSQFLYDIAKKYNDKLVIVRNGTEVDHFHKALDMENHLKRPVIGYYGAVSHWFAWEKVCYLARNLPQCDIVIIGAVTDYRDKLEKYKNIRLLGEMNYQDLPEHLAYFDVCLIPFDTSTDLIKATNPVKFYEYLSAGKRIVATEIPELEPYRDQYVYMSNDNQQFLEYVKLCLDGKDTLALKEECIAFATENDWQHRYEAFAQACLEATPKVSVVVLTYNNLALNKICIRSILENTAYPNYELIVLDNQSTDGTVEYLHELEQKNSSPNLKIIFNEENSGFAGGNNKAIRASSGKYVVLLNNDTVVTRGWLTALTKHLEQDPQCGMVGAVTNSIGNEQMIAVQYKNLPELAQFAYAYTQAHNGDIYTDVDRIPLFCTIIRKDMMNQYGMLDDGYKVGMFEDDDFAMLVKQAGYHFYAAEDCFIHHVNNASFKKLHPEEYQKIFNENRKRFEKKWNVVWTMPKYREGVTAEVNQGCMVEPTEN